MTLDNQLGTKKPGDPILSSDWNAVANETIRLDSAKLDQAGGTVSGLLTATGGLNASALVSNSLGLSVFTPGDGAWGHEASSETTVITAVLKYPVKTSVLIVGHGHAHSTSDQQNAQAVVLQLYLDGVPTNKDKDKNWGVGYLSVPFKAWGPIVTIGSANLEPTQDGHRVELKFRPADPGSYTVGLNGPTMWVVRLGSF
jgi:hypothetical protein